jgi:hypothetical protein
MYGPTWHTFAGPVDWYTTVLGFEVEALWPAERPNYAHFKSAGGATFAVMEAEGRRRRAHAHGRRGWRGLIRLRWTRPASVRKRGAARNPAAVVAGLPAGLRASLAAAACSTWDVEGDLASRT